MSKKEPWKNRIVESGERAASEFLANPKNWRVHPKAQREALTGVLSEVGWVQSVIVNRTTGNVVDGHARIEEALKLGDETPVPFVEVELTEAEEAKILATIDPISAMAGADKTALDSLLHEVETSSAAVGEMLAELAEKNGLEYGKIGGTLEDVEPQIDKAAELAVKWGTARGQVWRMGDHRLMCGDSTSADDVARLMAGERADAVVTDPPYGVGMLMNGGSWATKKDPQFTKMRDWDASTSQSFFDLVVSLGVPSVVWGGNYFSTPPSRCWLVWNKPELPSVSSSELAWTNVDANTKRIDCSRTHQADGEKEHATQKPLKVILWSLEFVNGSVVYDPFSGSGTTIMACEQLGRKCRAMEIAPEYVAVALERWATATGKTPELADE